VRKYLAEFIGTFFLMLTIGCTVLGHAPLAPLAIGVVLAAMVFAGGHISGAHYNPAVTVAVLVRGKIALADVPGYLVAQVAGAVLGGLTARLLVGGVPAQPFSVSGHVGVALVAELAFTFALAYVVLNVATSSDHPNNSFYGLAIGFTVAAGAVAVGGVSGGVFNPAVGFGVATAGLVSWSSLWLYAVANLAGGALAGLAFRYLNPGEFAPAGSAGSAGSVADVPAPRTESDSRARAAARAR